MVVRLNCFGDKDGENANHQNFTYNPISGVYELIVT